MQLRLAAYKMGMTIDFQQHQREDTVDNLLVHQSEFPSMALAFRKDLKAQISLHG